MLDDALLGLAGAYPEVHRLLGGRDFDACARAGLAAQPERGDVGKTFPDLIAAHWRGPGRAFIADLARVERAHLEVAAAPSSPSLRATELAALTPAEWEQARLVTVPALRLLALDYPIHRYLVRARDRDDAPLPRARPSWVVVWRNQSAMMRGELEKTQHKILSAVSDGRTLGQAVATAATRENAASLVSSLGNWFRQWTVDGIFTALVTEAASVD